MTSLSKPQHCIVLDHSLTQQETRWFAENIKPIFGFIHAWEAESNFEAPEKDSLMTEYHYYDVIYFWRQRDAAAFKLRWV